MAKIDVEQAKLWILNSLGLHAQDLSSALATRFQISRASALAVLKNLVQEGVLTRSGPVNRPVFADAANVSIMHSYSFPLGDVKQLWNNDFSPFLSQKLSLQQRNLLEKSFFELATNSAAYSKGTSLHVVLEQSAHHLEMTMQDNGIGMFKHIGLTHKIAECSQAVALFGEHMHAVPSKGLGQWLHAFDYFLIEANGQHYPVDAAPEEVPDEELFEQGTTVIMQLTLQ